MEDRKKEGLLEYLHREVGCSYLSDLRYRPWLQECRRVVTRLNPEAYTLMDWTEAYCYLLGRQKAFADACQAREGILQELDVGRIG
jgi:hypothetical protein